LKNRKAREEDIPYIEKRWRKREKKGYVVRGGKEVMRWEVN